MSGPLHRRIRDAIDGSVADAAVAGSPRLAALGRAAGGSIAAGLAPVHDWQRRALEQLIADEGLTAMQRATRDAIAARRSSKVFAHRQAVHLALLRGEHVHIVGVGHKIECANGTCTPEQLKPPARAPEPELRSWIDEHLGPQADAGDESWHFDEDHPIPPELLGRLDRGQEHPRYAVWQADQ